MLIVSDTLLFYRCKVNCFTKVNAEFSFSLETECLDCRPGEVIEAAYNWALFKETDHSFLPVTQFAQLTSTGNSLCHISFAIQNAFLCFPRASK